MRKLLVEELDFVLDNVEEVDPISVMEAEAAKDFEGTVLKLTGTFSEADKPNRNKRLYTSETWRRESKSYQAHINRGTSLGKAYHPSFFDQGGPSSTLHVTHRVTKLEYDESTKLVTGELIVIDTHEGEDIQKIYKHKGRVGISSRGYGSSEYHKEYKVGDKTYKDIEVIGEDYRLQAYDLVLTPGVASAYMSKKKAEGLDESGEDLDINEAVSLNSKGVTKANSLVSSGKIDMDSSWSFSTSDEDAILGDPPNWTEYGKWFLATRSDTDSKTKEHYAYPFGKNGKIYRRGVIAVKQRASQQGATSVVNSADALLKKIDKKKKKESYMTLEEFKAEYPDIYKVVHEAAVNEGKNLANEEAKTTIAGINEKLKEAEVKVATLENNNKELTTKISVLEAEKTKTLIKEKVAESIKGSKYAEYFSEAIIANVIGSSNTVEAVEGVIKSFETLFETTISNYSKNNTPVVKGVKTDTSQDSVSSSKNEEIDKNYEESQRRAARLS